MTYEREKKRPDGRHLAYLTFEDADTQQEMEDYGSCWEVRLRFSGSLHACTRTQAHTISTVI